MTESYQKEFTVDRSPDQVFNAICAPQIWWNALIHGSAGVVGDEFGFAMEGVHSTRMRVAEATPGTKVVWTVLENHFSFVDDQDEWLGTDVVFELTPRDLGTVVTVTHVGLVPGLECYEVCSGAWSHHLDVGLRAMLTGETPEPMTAELAAEAARAFAAKESGSND
jgi:uncharacterized protein YndB with AHSA1/START domain